jgi:hypothetical protein
VKDKRRLFNDFVEAKYKDRLAAADETIVSKEAMRSQLSATGSGAGTRMLHRTNHLQGTESAGGRSAVSA